MVDIFTKAERSELMSKVHGGGNKSTELAMIALFRKYGVAGWRRHRPLLGRPDFVFLKSGLAVFVDGCFWHGCPKHGTWPKQNAAFWRKKIRRNIARDREVSRILKGMGWRILRIWQHELTKKNEVRLFVRIRRALDR